jgi:hypothetical protein
MCGMRILSLRRFARHAETRRSRPLSVPQEEKVVAAALHPLFSLIILLASPPSSASAVPPNVPHGRDHVNLNRMIKRRALHHMLCSPVNTSLLSLLQTVLRLKLEPLVLQLIPPSPCRRYLSTILKPITLPTVR